MASAKCVCVFAIACLVAVSAFSISYTPQSRGRKLFGGYRIVPKVCQPTNLSRTKSDEPAICMFNYECSRRNGEVVGACMDGFLFGACCQLPRKDSQGSSSQENISPSTDELLNLHEIDHVPDIPILLNPDGSPMGISTLSGTTKIDTYSSLNHLTNSAGSYTKVSTVSADSATRRPPTSGSHYGDLKENVAKPQIPSQVDISHLEHDFPALLGQQEILDDLRLPGLITHSDSNNDIQEHQETSVVNPVTTLLTPDQILQVADPVDQLPALFAQGLGQNNHSGADTVLLNENGTLLAENNNPDEFFKPNTGISNITDPNRLQNQSANQYSSTPKYSQSTNSEISGTSIAQQYENSQRITETTPGLKYTSSGFTDSRNPSRTTIYAQSSTGNNESGNTMLKIDVTTPMSSTYDDDELVRVPTITYDVHSGNKKHDELDREEIAINHIISILNATTPSSPTKITQQMPHGTSSIQTWVSIDETSKPSSSRFPTTRPSTTTESFPYTFYMPGRPSTYYHYDTASTQTSDGSSSFSTSSSSAGSSSFHTSRKPEVTPSSYGSSNGYDYSTRPSANPPAPTVIVLGPLGTEYTTVTTQKPASRRPTTGSIRPSLVTRLPSIGTTITHNISTIISTNSASTSNNHVVSTSYISVDLKDNTSPKPDDKFVTNDAVEAETIINRDEIITKRPSTIWTTLSTWSGKPTFVLKPSQSSDNKKPIHTVVFKDTTVTSRPETTVSMTLSTNLPTPVSTIFDDETPAPDDLIDFPPVRNPNLTPHETPTIVTSSNDTDLPDNEIFNENEIPTPSFIEDEVLTNKVDSFVHKIVASLQGNFQDLKEVVYSTKNITVTTPTVTNATKRPPTKKPAKSTTPRPAPTTTKRPGTKKPTRPPSSQKPANAEKPVVRPAKPTTVRPKPTSYVSSTTKKPQATKRPKPTRKITTTTTTTTTTTSLQAVEDDENESTEVSAQAENTTPDYRTQCGIRPLVKSGRIVGGKAAEFGEWPWQVLIRESTWLGLLTKNKCGGVLITNNWVLTAAHCSPSFLASLVAVFGEFDLSGELESRRSITRNVRRVITHRDYVQLTFQSDIALLELEKPVQFDAHIVPICLPLDDADYTGRMATVTGWGRVKYNGGTPSLLQEVQVPIMENSVCQEMFITGGQPKKLIIDSFLCAGYANGQKDSCEGDSGGPLMIEGPDGRWVLVGTVSHGVKCATPYLPGVYMRTTYFKPWIRSVTGV